MKTYSKEERIEAKAKLPKPVSDFLSSNTITEIYDGLIKKHRLNLWQGSLMSKVANLTLLGLEPVSALETNLHQALPELSSATTREIVNDLNDRIFKEANRRLHENIFEPEPEWDEEEFGKKPSPDEPRLLSDAELDKLAEKEEVEGWIDPEEKAEAEAERARAATTISTLSTSETIRTSAPIQTIATEKLGIIPTPPSEISTIRSIQKVTPVTEVVSAPTKTTTPETGEQKPPQTTPSPKIDPYREPIE